MRLSDERIRDGVRARTVECDCGVPTCETRFLLFQARHEQLWCCLGWSTTETSDEDADQAFEMFGEINDLRLEDIVEYYVALIGLTWPVITASARVCAAQLEAAMKVPLWMFKVPVEMVWKVRGCVFGDDLTRVQRALWAAHEHYKPDRPVREARFR